MRESMKSKLFGGTMNDSHSYNGSHKTQLMADQIQKQKDRLEGNKRLTQFKKSLTKNTLLAGTHIPTFQEKIQMLPPSFEQGDWEEPIIYTFFCVNYYQEDVFYEVLRRVGNFSQWPALYKLFRGSLIIF